MSKITAELLKAARAELRRREERAALKADCEKDLMAFVQAFWPVVEPATPLIKGWVLETMCDILMAAADGHIRRLCLNVPPGSMKSTLLNVFFPAWLWGAQNKPHLRFISASYSTMIPERDNSRLLRVLQSDTYRQFWGDRVQIVREGVGLIETSATGSKRVVSTDGGTTGHRADFLLLDDINNPTNVESDTVRHATNHWLREVMPDRLNDLKRSVIINIQQRTHEQDATGTLLQFGYLHVVIPLEFDPARFQHVVLRRNKSGEATQVWADPRGLDSSGKELAGLVMRAHGGLEAKPGSPMAQAEGTLCWPERYPEDEMEKMKNIKGPYAWAAQYLQLPTVRGGAIIRREWWRRWTRSVWPEFGTVIASLDTAIKEGTENDFNALTILGAFADEADRAPQIMLADAWRVRTNLADLVRMVAESCRKHNVDYLLIEDKARGHDVAAEIKRLYANAPWDTLLLQIKGGRYAQDKVTRVLAVTPMFSGPVRKDTESGLDIWDGGMFWAPEAPWAEEVIAETTSFPRGAHDDYVDCLAQAALWMRRTGLAITRAEFRETEDEAMQYQRPVGVPYAIHGPADA